MNRPILICFTACLLTTVACSDPAEYASSKRAVQTIVYVGKQTTTDFTGLGQHLQYWPLFGLTSPQTARRTDDPACIELTPDFASFNHHYLPPGRTFSNDALGIPIGTKTRGGYPTWDSFTLPDGRTGRSGTFYDESNIDNSNNTVNKMRINVSTLHDFCLNLITDNTNGEHNADVRFEARSDDVDFPLANHPDFGFDGQTDMYTFRYTGMEEDDVFKIRLQCSSASGCQGAGLGGIMVSHISTCTPGGADGGTDAAVDSGALDTGMPGDAGGPADANPRDAADAADAADASGPADTGAPDADPVDATSDAGGPDDAADTGATADADVPQDASGNTDTGSGVDLGELPAPDNGGCDCSTNTPTGAGLGFLLFGLCGLRVRRSRRQNPSANTSRQN